MANVKGWAKFTHRSKPVVADLDSTGMAFGFIGGPPHGVHFTLRRKDGRRVEVELTHAEARDLKSTLDDFFERVRT